WGRGGGPGPRDLIGDLLAGRRLVYNIAINGEAWFNRPLLGVKAGATAIELDGLGSDHVELLHVAGGPGVELDRAAIRDRESHLELGNAGAQRIAELIFVLLVQGHGSAAHRHELTGNGLSIDQGSAIGQIELECRLGLGWSGGIVNHEKLDSRQ